MAEISNNHLGCIKAYTKWDKLPINWCRISAINSRLSLLCRISDVWIIDQHWKPSWLHPHTIKVTNQLSKMHAGSFCHHCSALGGLSHMAPEQSTSVYDVQRCSHMFHLAKSGRKIWNHKCQSHFMIFTNPPTSLQSGSLNFLAKPTAFRILMCKRKTHSYHRERESEVKCLDDLMGP